MDKDLLTVALRAGALYLTPEFPLLEPSDPSAPNQLTKSTIYCLQELILNGFILDEEALHAFNLLDPRDKAVVLEVIDAVMGTHLNWTPLVRNWREPTGEGFVDHLLTAFYNTFVSMGSEPVNSTLLPCGHYIPDGTFDLSRYTGCPFCGKPFVTSDFTFKGQGSKLKVLKYWTQADMDRHFLNLLTSTVPLSSPQIASLKTLLQNYDVPDVRIEQHETLMVVLDFLNGEDRFEEMIPLFRSPADVLRYVWFETTSQLQVIKPKTLMRLNRNNRHMLQSPYSNNDEYGLWNQKLLLKMKFDRAVCRMAAKAFCQFDMSAQKACEIMNPKRGMWVRAIRALRLAEYSHKPGYEKLNEILDRFYNKDYYVAQGAIDAAWEANDYAGVRKVLKANPGMFARELFSTMLKFKPDEVLADFTEVLDKLPLRLIFSLDNNADLYFNNISGTRVIRDITGQTKQVAANPNLDKYSELELQDMAKAVHGLVLKALEVRYAKRPCPGQKIYIAPELYDIVLPIGDRILSTSTDVMAVPQGTRFEVLGDEIRLFLQWGKGLKAAHIDLDLSAAVIFENTTEVCSYYSLTIKGAQHSGDIRQIPDYVGTAEYVNLNVPELRKRGAKYVAFVANCYSTGSLGANAMAGWMDSKFPMAVDNDKGVAYDPSCVQYLVKVNDSMLSEGLVFGVLDVVKNQIIYLEMPFSGRIVACLNVVDLRGFLYRLTSKVTIGKALAAMAEACQMEVVKDSKDIDADTQVYDAAWSLDIPAVTALLVPND